MYTPGTQMTSMFEGQPLKARPCPIKTWVIYGFQVYIYRYPNGSNGFLPATLCFLPGNTGFPPGWNLTNPRPTRIAVHAWSRPCPLRHRRCRGSSDQVVRINGLCNLLGCPRILDKSLVNGLYKILMNNIGFKYIVVILSVLYPTCYPLILTSLDVQPSPLGLDLFSWWFVGGFDPMVNHQ